MSKLLASAVIPVVCGIGLAAPAQAQGDYIVIAGSDSTHAFEAATGGSLASLSQVEEFAVSHCADRHGATDCRVLAEGQGGCVALANAGQSLVGAWGATRNAARAAVVAKVGLAGAKVGLAGAKVDTAHCLGDPQLTPPGSESFLVTQ
jgi:Domain of unknown function (DUF4189)